MIEEFSALDGALISLSQDQFLSSKCFLGYELSIAQSFYHVIHSMVLCFSCLIEHGRLSIICYFYFSNEN